MILLDMGEYWDKVILKGFWLEKLIGLWRHLLM